MVNKNFKKIIILGPSTSGKSTFARIVSKKYGVTYFPLDIVVEAFQIFPETQIRHALSLKEHRIVQKRFRKPLKRIIEALEIKEQGYVVEGLHIDLEYVAKKYHKDHKIVVFGFPNATPEERIKNCIAHDPTRWPDCFSYKQMISIFKEGIQESKSLEKKCKRLKIPFFDTGRNYKEKLKSALEILD